MVCIIYKLTMTATSKPKTRICVELDGYVPIE